MNTAMVRNIFPKGMLVRYAKQVMKHRPVDQQKFVNRIIRDYDKIMDSLINDTYHPQPLRVCSIPKGQGEYRKIYINPDLDRIILSCINEYLSPVIDGDFNDNNYGFRQDRGCIMAVNKVLEYLDSGYEYVIKTDLKSYFDTIDQDTVRYLLTHYIEDDGLRKLLFRFITIPVEGSKSKRTFGIQQGSSISPLIANMVLNRFDHILTDRGYRFIRYADDLCILKRSVVAARRTLESINHLLQSEFKLKLNNEKTVIRNIHDGFDLLGFTIIQRSEGRHIVPMSSRVRNLLKNIETVGAMNPDVVVSKLNSIIRGWYGYFQISDLTDIVNVIDREVMMAVRRSELIHKQTINTEKLVSLRHLCSYMDAPVG